jgi:hypothetical protein
MADDQEKPAGGLPLLIEALTIFTKYTDKEYVTHCEHDVLHVFVDPNTVTPEDKDRLKVLGFHSSNVSGDYMFISYRHGRA